MSNNNDWTPNYGGNTQFTKKKHFGFNKDTNTIVFRVLPQPKGFKYGTVEYNNTPFSGTWHRYVSTIFGFKNTEGKLRVFESPLVKNNKTKTVDSPCVATDFINNLKAKLEEARASGNAAVQSKLNKLVGLQGVYNINNNQHMNVVLLDGQIGELQLRYKAFVALKAKIDKVREGSKDELGFDPLSFNNGRFFVMTRSNTGRDTTFDVQVYKEKIDVPGHGKVDKDLVHAITSELLARLETEGYNLNKIHSKITSEECAQIVGEVDLMSGKSPACDRIFDIRWKAEREAKKAQVQPEQQEEEQDNGENTSTDTASPTASSVTSTTGPDTPNYAIAAPTGTPPVTAQLSTPATAPSTTDDELSDEEFFRIAGIKTSA
jgi:hypothetical protein